MLIFVASMTENMLSVTVSNVELLEKISTHSLNTHACFHKNITESKTKFLASNFTLEIKCYRSKNITVTHTHTSKLMWNKVKCQNRAHVSGTLRPQTSPLYGLLQALVPSSINPQNKKQSQAKIFIYLYFWNKTKSCPWVTFLDHTVLPMAEI